MRTEDLTLSAIDAGKNTAGPSIEEVSAVCYAAHAGFGPAACHRFVAALVVCDLLRSPNQWGQVLRKVRNLELAEQVATLEAGRPVVGDI
jgi:hypothetical protein